MKICLCQTAPRWGDVAANVAATQQLALSQPEADLYVLPEVWATGFHPEAAVPAAPEAEAWMRRFAVERRCGVAGSLAVEAGGGSSWRNRFFFFHPDGSMEYYDKRHIFSLSGEDRQFGAGAARRVVSFGGARLLLQVCYDLRFPVWSRCRGDYDVALYVAAWPAARRRAWDALLQARAVENQCYVVGVNRTGEGADARYDGGSCAYAPDGTCLLRLDEAPAAAVVEVDTGLVERFRRRFPFLADADDYALRL